MSQCKKCGGNGWLWWFELEDYDGPALENGNDDTRYLCYECGTEPRESTSETVPKSSPMKTKSEKSPPNLVARTGIEPVCDAPEIETIVADQQDRICELFPDSAPAFGNRPQTVPTRSLLDVFCGVGGWSKTFLQRGWNCTGVDLADFSASYPGNFVQADALSLQREWIDSFDAVLMSPPCEEFARAWLPWLRGDKAPEKWAIDLLEWSVALCDRPGRMVECSNFSARHVAGAVRVGSYSLWGDVPLLIRNLPRGKMAKSGTRPELRAEIPHELARSVAEWFEAGMRIKNPTP